ncbi:DUF2752 domain-containing protein [Anaeromyxobacter paludicola]|uniref:DUF2752 domain-containing protein n=1 Tax=Anaeromyxobacter paludicola TaxID=2918171 RepID=A0ABM7XDD2_9BACT|nr:DUF2752 domain-containing protein [Anaeromyxobacter paludicola]BDG09891.1 hypothetical protein AMPC_30040 [Anaeromyxobacter paludicola]
MASRAEARPPFGHVEVFALLGASSFLAARFFPVLALRLRCPLLALTGWPCPTCGMTRAFVRLAHGAVGGAVAASPLGALLAAAAWAFGAAALAAWAAGRPLPALPRPAQRALAAALVGLAAVNWSWLCLTRWRSP